MNYLHAAVLATALIASGWAVNAHASEGYSDPSDLRTSRMPTVTIKPADGGSNAQDPFGMRTRGITFADPGTQLAGQPVHRTQPLAHAHAPTVTNASPNG